MTAIGSVLNVREGGSAPVEEACAGSIPLSPLVELGVTIGATELGTAVEDSEVEACATAVDGVAPGDAGADGAAASTGPAGSVKVVLGTDPVRVASVRVSEPATG